MNIKMKISVVIIGVILMSCGSEKDKNYDSYVPDSIWSFDTRKDAEPIGQLNTIASTDEGLVVVDGEAYQAFLLDNRGSVDRQYGRRGEGPGEYSSNPMLVSQADSVLAVSEMPTSRRVHIWGVKGDYISTLKLEGPMLGTSVLGDTTILSYEKIPKSNYVVKRYDKKGKILYEKEIDFVRQDKWGGWLIGGVRRRESVFGITINEQSI